MSRISLPLVSRRVRWALVVVVAGIILYYSIVPLPLPNGGTPPGTDTVEHGFAYFGLAGSLLYATIDSELSTRNRVALVVAVAVLFGGGIEILQGTVVNRDASVFDLLADTGGALLAQGWLWVESRIELRRLPATG